MWCEPTCPWFLPIRAIGLLNLGKSGNQTVFDAEMPSGKYSDLQLKVTGHDFLATVTVSGSQSQTAAIANQAWLVHDLRSDAAKAGPQHGASPA